MTNNIVMLITDVTWIMYLFMFIVSGINSYFFVEWKLKSDEASYMFNVVMFMLIGVWISSGIALWGRTIRNIYPDDLTEFTSSWIWHMRQFIPLIVQFAIMRWGLEQRSKRK